MRRLVFVVMSMLSVAACHKVAGDDTALTDAPALTGEKYTVTWGPVTIPPNTESTQCIWMRLPNAAPVMVHQMHNVLSAASHHLIVYKDDMDTAEQLTPMPCQPFTGALNASGMIAPLAITQKRDDMITLPSGVAYNLGANQMMKVEMHYINSTDAPVDATASVDLYLADPATIHDEASVFLAGSPDINIPAGQMMTLHQFLTMPSTMDLSAAHIFAITGHTHHLGTNVQVSVAPSRTGPMTPVYSPAAFSWTEPETQQQNPDFNVPVGGGFDFTCSYYNTTGAAVKFGESANNEMCFFWAYYWPSQGSRVCIHTQQYGGVNGYDTCCPGDSVCSLIHI